MDYNAKVDALKEKYEPRILAIMANIAEAFRVLGLEPTKIVDLCDDEYRWAFDANGVGVDFTIVEQLASEGDGQGVTFRIDLTGSNSEILGGIAPFNYTKQCWVDINDVEAIEDRFSIIEDADPCEFVNLVPGDK